MATYKGIGFDTANGRTRTGTNSDIVEFDSQIKGDDGLNITTGGANIVGNSSITGNLTVSGTLIAEDEQQILVKDNFLDLNFGETSTSYSQTGLTFNFKATTAGANNIDTSTNNVVFTAGTTSARAKFTVATSVISGTAFSAQDIIQISGTTNSST